MAMRLPMAPSPNTATRMRLGRFHELADVGLGPIDVGCNRCGIGGGRLRRDHGDVGDPEETEQEFQIWRYEIRRRHGVAIATRAEGRDDDYPPGLDKARKVF